MKVRSIPPKTIPAKRRGKAEEKAGTAKEEEYLFKKPREWIYETKPFFKKVREPLVDVFKEAEEVRIVIDLGGFRREEVTVDIQGDRYVITAVRNGHVFREELVFPREIDTGNIEERFKNGILEIVLRRKKADG